MGYTQSWIQRRDATPEEWRALTADFLRMLPLLPAPILLGDWQGLPGSLPSVTDKEISFNDIRDPYETMRLTRQIQKAPSWEGYGFCKTNQKPYDLAVTSLLLLAQKHIPDAFDIRSDGGAESLTDARVFLMRSLDYVITCPYDREQQSA